jgi:hypothetical protein
MEIDCYEFLHMVEAQCLDDTDVQLITVSHGSDDARSMIFGWVIALPTSGRLA